MARELRPIVRDPFSVVFGLVQPLVFLGLFGPLLAGMTGLSRRQSLQWFVPGVLVMLALFGTSTTGANLLLEMQTGSHERMLVTPLRRSALLVGRALKEIAPTLAQAALIIVVVTLPFGFRFAPVGAVLGLLMLAVFSVGMGALSYALALAVKGSAVGVLAGAADAAVPDVDPGRDAAAAGRPARAGCGRRRWSTHCRTWSTPSGRCSPGTRSPGPCSAGWSRRPRPRSSGSGSAPARWPARAEPATGEGVLAPAYHWEW